MIGTRPEAIKLGPVMRVLGADVFYTGQHPGVGGADWRGVGVLPCDCAGYDVVVVQGDTFSTLAGAWTAFMQGVPVAHVEAGLRTADVRRPFPEEAIRRMVAELADFHFCPTAGNARNLGGRPNVHVVGNPGIDAALAAVEGVAVTPGRFALATVHRRESWSRLVPIVGTLDEIARTLVPVKLLAHHSTIETIRGVANDLELLPAQSHATTLGLVRDAALVLTDSGGLQEEAPIFGTPVVVLRDETERMEGVEAGCALLAGTDHGGIMAAAHTMLRRPRTPMMPYGDGRAADRIATVLRTAFA